MPLSSLAPAPLPVPARRAVDSDRRRTSASAILRSVLAHGPVARSTIARLTGLSPASVTDHCNRLTALGLIQEAATLRRSNGVGRPHVPVDLDDSRFVVGGVHVAVPYTTVALLDLRGRVVAERRLNHGEEGGDSDQQAPPPAPAQVLADAASGLRALLAAAPGRVPLGVGVATGGWVDRDSGTIVEHPLLGWRDVRAREVIHALTGLPVHVDGHARALVNGERLFGRTADRGRSLLHLFVGNVVDAAFATHDEVHHGPRSQSGAIAHLPLAGGTERCDCGRTGCLQAELSERTLCRRAREAGVVRTSDPMHVLAAAPTATPSPYVCCCTAPGWSAVRRGSCSTCSTRTRSSSRRWAPSTGRTASPPCVRRSVPTGRRPSCRPVFRTPCSPWPAARWPWTCSTGTR